jgi:hypothetical protein
MYKIGKKRTVIECDYSEIEEIIKKEYNFNNFSIMANEEAVSDIVLRFNVDGDLSEFDRKDIKEKKQMYRTNIYLNDLARQNKIKKANILFLYNNKEGRK